MRVYKVGHIFTDQGLAYAEGLRRVLSINRDPGPPVPMEMTERQWAALEPTAVHIGDVPAPAEDAPNAPPAPATSETTATPPFDAVLAGQEVAFFFGLVLGGAIGVLLMLGITS